MTLKTLMTNIMKNAMRLMSKVFLALILTLPLVVSCFDDSKLWEAIDQLEMRVDSLENNLNTQMKAVSEMLSSMDDMLISSCVMNSDGSYVITLADGKCFTVLPQDASISSMVSIITVNEKKYWATYDEYGVLTPLLDANGKAIPVDLAISIKIVDGRYYLVVADNTIETCYDTEDIVQVFSSCTPLKDDSGQVYAVKFVLGEGVEVTVTVDGYRGVIFKLSEVNTTIISEYFIDCGTTQTFLLDNNGVVDYVMQIPDGWRVTEKNEELTGNVFVSITAPERSAIEIGAAVATGDLKIVSVVEGGKAAVTKLKLSTDPFKTFNVTSLNAVVETYNGVQKFIYGLVTMNDDFDAAAIVAEANKILSDSSYLPDGYYVADGTLNKTHEEIYPDLQEGGAYLFFAIPAMYSEGTAEEQPGFYAREDMMRTHSLVPVFVGMQISGITLLDANLKLNVMGAEKIYADLTFKTDQAIDEVLYLINNGAIEPLENADFFSTYNGPVSEFPNPDYPTYMEPNTTYVVWCVPIEEGKSEYSASDVVYREFTTLDLSEGGSLAVNLGDSTSDPSSISCPVSCEDAAMIYYTYLNNDDGEFYSASSMSNSTRWNAVLNSDNVTVVRGSSIDAIVDGLMPETTMWLFAAAVGHDGLYGEVKFKSAKSASVTFNSLSVEVETTDVQANKASFKINVTGGTAMDYIYWVGRTSNDFWVTTCAKSEDVASKYMAANPGAEVIAASMKNGKVSSEGTFTVSGLTLDKEHIALVLAKDGTGNYSKVGSLKFNTLAVSLGDDFVAEGTDEWTRVKTWIENNIEWDKNSFSASAGSGQGFASYSFSIKTPTDMTAYISCFSPVATELSDIILEQVTFCSKSRDLSVGGVEEPDNLVWIDDKGKEHNASIYFSVYDTYVHGAPTYGYVTYFANNGHVENGCTSWDSGECTNYASALERFREKLSIDHWKEWIAENCNYAYMGDPDHQYSYALTDETKINALAQAFVDAYTPYYTDREPLLYVNNGRALTISNREAVGLDTNGNVMDKVYVILKDLNGNYYAPMTIEVPNYFK